ncbi:YqaE/Pmp3 family membrane protein, partial [Flavobacterium sp.]|uniref:YqaE/Pmp3 family membrane protein n=1 Tax=Flavobacterium sp. TaxID=239 RepID=UPI003751FE98
AFFLPWLSLILQGKIFSEIICLLFQLTIIGWIPAFIWVYSALNRMYANRITNKIIKKMNTN